MHMFHDTLVSFAERRVISMKIKQKNSKIKHLIQLLIIAAAAWVLGQLISPALMKAIFL